jgi:hypothetical protein
LHLDITDRCFSCLIRGGFRWGRLGHSQIGAGIKGGIRYTAFGGRGIHGHSIFFTGFLHCGGGAFGAFRFLEVFQRDGNGSGGLIRANIALYNLFLGVGIDPE